MADGEVLEIRDERLRELVVDEPLARLQTGFRFIEGPVWNQAEGYLLFSDIQADRMYRRSATGELTTYRRPSRMANGNAYDGASRLLTCEHATSRLVREEADGGLSVLAERFDGRELNSPNDVVVAKDGTILFTDPVYGRVAPHGVPREPELPFRGVYKVDPASGELSLLAKDFNGPNGLCLSVDERYLFVNDTERLHIRRFGFDGGALTGGVVWAEVAGEGIGVPDGMKVDSSGNLYCTGPGGIHVFDADATCLGVIRVPENPANFTWGGRDLCSLYICATTSLYRCRTKLPGLAPPTTKSVKQCPPTN
ncbi:SMP-30/gluconolactonase/LRE family protein [Saccharopolyspora gloriosae]|uniref:SMP-30/gluconolactonase/LRE family protein n=1 Tax=Saccharopolyspora gloriosae TaxID=455344 RepID=UPI001FB62CD4|nr:SMP-30/gluconolactonase/LRE family protein [Saccharopolyspora gloriosae]